MTGQFSQDVGFCWAQESEQDLDSKGMDEALQQERQWAKLLGTEESMLHAWWAREDLLWGNSGFLWRRVHKAERRQAGKGKV